MLKEILTLPPFIWRKLKCFYILSIDKNAYTVYYKDTQYIQKIQNAQILKIRRFTSAV